MNKLLTAILAAAFAASPVYAQTTAAPAKDEKKAEAKKSGRGHESPGSRARAIPFCAPSIDAGMIVGYPKG